jgi:hypothetical protein
MVDTFLLAALIVCALFWSVGACMLLRASTLSRRMQREIDLHAPLLCVFVTSNLLDHS